LAAVGVPTSHISVLELARRVGSEMSADDVTGLAAEMSFYFVLSVFPFLILVAALVGTLPFTGAWSQVLKWIMLYFPQQAQSLIFDMILHITDGRKGFFPIGILGTAWAASSGLMSLMGALNRIYEVNETRSYVRRLALAVLMVVVLALLLLSTFGLLTAGDWLDQRLAARSGVAAALVLWRLVRWIISLVLIGVGIALLDRNMPNLRRPWRRITPGVAFIILGWLLSSVGFNLYAQHLASFNKTYGVLGVFVMLMVWIYIASIITLAGAEINSELSKMTAQIGDALRTGTAVVPPARS
jgi:membrane protein